MKKILILCFVAFQSCLPKNDKLEGNWYACDHNGNYQELLIKKDSLRLVLSVGHATSWANYKIKSDTLYILNSTEWRDSTKAILGFNTDNTLSIKFTNTNYTTVYRPLNKVVKNPDKYRELIFETKNRARKSECNK
tara:strand:+ start:108 stop:515 length:408 start_codon:yes stop_codon:yes gene_type:complete